MLLAIADFSLLGRSFEEGEVQLSVSPEFYHEKTCGAKSAKKLVKSATIVNAVGKDIVALLIGEGLVDKAGILNVEGVPHAQIITM